MGFEREICLRNMLENEQVGTWLGHFALICYLLMAFHFLVHG
jgi:hypothetical protein